MNLKPIPGNTVVHTPTEEEAKELLAILHQNGYEWMSKDCLLDHTYWVFFKHETKYRIKNKSVDFSGGYFGNAITLSELKEKYLDDTCTDDCSSTVQVEHPHNEALNLQGFAEGTLLFVRKTNDLRALLIMLHDNGYKPCKEFATSLDRFLPAIEILREKKFRFVPIIHNEEVKGGIKGSAYLEMLDMYATLKKNHKRLYNSHGRLYKNRKKKSTVDMGTIGKQQGEKGNNSENSQLNLCELLHDGDTVYSLVDGIGKVELLDEDGFRLNNWCFRNDGTFSGSDSSTAKCLIFPSRKLYEQYPLDPQKAWQKWQSEQKKPFICIHWGEVDCNGDEEEDYTGNFYFRTPADRDKCIEVIDAFLKQINH